MKSNERRSLGVYDACLGVYDECLGVHDECLENSSVCHHGWSTQAAWTNFFRREFSSVYDLRINTEFLLLLCSGTCLKDCMGGVEIIFCVLLWLKLGPISRIHFSEESRKL